MKPIYSEEDRYKIVLNFIAERGSGQIPIIDFSPLLRYLPDITPLREIKKTSHPERYPDGTYRITSYSGHVSNPVDKNELCYGREDAEEYFNWLMYMLTADDKATDEQRKEAVNQLFLFIFVLRDKIKIDLSDFLKGHFEWEARMRNIDEILKGLETNMSFLEHDNQREHLEYNEEGSNQDEKIKVLDNKLQQEHVEMREIDNRLMDVLEKIRKWQRQYEPCLKDLLARHEEETKRMNKVFDRGNNNEKTGKH